jgi:ABC-type multidrug transport system ATPase subunit
MTDHVIRTDALVKRYGRLTAVDDLGLSVREGDRYGFLGPNGSGKTTTVRMLLGLVLPTSGEVELLGSRKVRSMLPDVGAMVEGPAAYGHLDGRTNLRLSDSAGPGGPRRTRKQRVDETLERVGLAGIDKRPVKSYSLGMRQRLGLATALLQKPRLLVLDEPTNGLDPQGILEFRELLLELNDQGTTVFLSSHLLAEVEALCTRIGVIDKGRLVAQDSLAALTAPTGRVEVHTPDVARVKELLGSRIEVTEGERLLIRHEDPATLNALLVGEGVRVPALFPEKHTLEETVLSLTTGTADRA